MRILLAWIALSLLVVGCGNADKRLHQKISGTWTLGSVGIVSFGADGKCLSTMNNKTQQWRYEGRWAVKDGALYVRTTRSNSVPVNEIICLKVVRADGAELVYEMGGQKMVLKRKK